MIDTKLEKKIGDKQWIKQSNFGKYLRFKILRHKIKIKMKAKKRQYFMQSANVPIH